MKLWKKLAFTGVSALLLGTLAACKQTNRKRDRCKSQYQLHWLGRLRKENERHHFFRGKL